MTMTDDARAFSDLRSTGLLWLINATVFHPRGFALAIVMDENGAPAGWRLFGNGAEPWSFDSPCDDQFRATQMLFAQHRAQGA